MDSLTQIVLGGAVGEATLGRRAGNKAVLWGAIAGTIPDLDVIGSAFLDPVASADFHRGPSHSLVFSLVVAPALGALIARIHRKEGLGVRPWAWLSFWCLVTHPLLDIFTTWGTEFFWPFLPDRIAFNSVFVVDPAYTLPFLACLIAVLWMRRSNPKRRIVNWIGIAWSCLYLAIGLGSKATARQAFVAEMTRQHIAPEDYMTKPAPMTALLWGIVARSGNTFWMGYHSLPSGEQRIHLQAYESKPPPPEIWEQQKVRDLRRIAKDYLFVQELEDGWMLSDLRFMTADFELDGDEQFIFNFVLREEAGELVLEQRRGVPDLDGDKMRAYWQAIWNGPRANGG